MNKVTKTIIISFFILAVAVYAYGIGYHYGEEKILKTAPGFISQGESQPNKVDFSVFWEVWRRVTENYFDKSNIDYKKMVYGAVQGMVKALGDPYTYYFSPNEAKEFNQELSGKYEGIGAEIGSRNKQITIISPLKGSPAEKAGVKPGDVILKIDNVYTDNLSIAEAVDLIKGKKGTKVTLLIKRDSWNEPKEITIKRDVIEIPTLDLEFLNAQGNKVDKAKAKIALIKIYQFNNLVDSEFRKAALDILDSNADRIIVDLRNNPGGFFNAAQEVGSMFIKKGEIIVWEQDGSGKKTAFRSDGPSSLSNYPVVVLINQGSASAAEILAAALKVDRGAMLIGKTSFGKGLIQKQINLFDGSSLKVTIAKWLTPAGDCINKIGLKPDVEVELTEDDWNKGKDPQLKKAVEIIDSLQAAK